MTAPTPEPTADVDRFAYAVASTVNDPGASFLDALVMRNAVDVQSHGGSLERDMVSIPRYLLEDLEECVGNGTRHSDAADAAWALLNPGAQL